MNLTSRVVIPSQVMARQLGHETVILDLASGTYYGLDPVGARMWHLMAEGRSLGEACECMLSEYDVDAVAIQRDVLVLAQTLLDKKLIELSTGS